MNTSPVLLQVNGISKTFPGVKALDQVSLTLHAGEVLAVVGENGAGKSTLMKILGGVYTPDSGEIFVDGRPAVIRHVTDAMQQGISLIHQELNLAENLSVAANIFLGREFISGGPFGFLQTQRMQAEARRLMDQVGLDCSPAALVGTLAPGRRQLVEIARALSLRVRILIMDEPTSSLTQRETDKLYAVIRELRGRGVAVVYISHRLVEVEQLADRVVVLRDGRNAGELERRPTDSSLNDSGKSQAIEPEALARATLASASGSIAPALGISHAAMVRLMVGRELSQFFQRQHAPSFDRVRLELKDFRCGGLQGVPNGLSQPISLQIHAGEILGLAGLIGAGRTELAEAIFGLRPVLSGQIRLDSQPIRLGTPQRAVAAGVLLVPEDRRQHGLILQDTVKRNLSLPNLDQLNALRWINRRAEKALAERMCQQLHVRTPGIGQIVGLLSGGNQQKVVIGKWLARQPRVLIVDEPTRGVDVRAKSEIYALMDRLAGEGVAILMISSDLEEILGMSDRVAVLHQGRLTGVRPREQVTQETIMNLATGGKALHD